MRWTPGTAAIARCAAGVIPGPTAGAVTTASAPAACHDAATSAAATALRAIAAKAITANARTSANAGSTPACAAAPPRAKPTTITTPRRRPASRVSWRSTTGYPRITSRAAGIATSTGAAAVKKSVLPGGGRPCWRRMTSPPTAAQTSMMSATHRRAAASRRRASGRALRAGDHATGPVPPPGQHRGAGQRGHGDQARQPPRQHRRGPRGHRDGRGDPHGRGGQHRDGAAAQRHQGDLPQRRPARPHHGVLTVPVHGDQPGTEQHHHRADHRQADEQQRQGPLHGIVGRHERGQDDRQPAAEADHERALGCRPEPPGSSSPNWPPAGRRWPAACAPATAAWSAVDPAQVRAGSSSRACSTSRLRCRCRTRPPRPGRRTRRCSRTAWRAVPSWVSWGAAAIGSTVQNVRARARPAGRSR